MSHQTKPFEGQVRMEWYQSNESVTFTFYVKDRSEADVTVHATTTALNISILLDGQGRTYDYSLDPLYDAIADAAPAVSVRPMKVEVIIRKRTPIHWLTLEAKESGAPAATTVAPSSSGPVPASAKDLTYPNSKGKDWSKLQLDVEEEKAEGEQALNNLFKQIYGDGTDEQRKAMIKSFTESGGTVLSTNWDDVKAKKVEVSPPTGMEAKKLQE